MNVEHAQHRLSKEFQELSEICSRPGAVYGDVMVQVTTRGHALLTLFLCIPFLTPIPLPGVSTVLGFAIAVIGTQMALDIRPWLPSSWLKRPVAKETFRKIFDWFSRVLTRIEVLFRPRGRIFVKHPWVQRLSGAAIAVLGVLLALPLPPGTNFPPAIGIFVLSFAILEADGLALIFGFAIAALNLVFFTALAVLGYEGIQALMESFF